MSPPPSPFIAQRSPPPPARASISASNVEWSLTRDAAKDILESNDLARRLSFLREIDRLKSITRASPLLDRSRRENSAEHSWHLSMYAWLLADHAAASVDVPRVVKMLLIHDIVEVDAGDTPIHGGVDAGQAEKELRAARRLFGLLPPDQCDELIELWREFEAGQSDDARFAKALDRFQPLLTNIFAGGGTWTDGDVSYEQVLERYGPAIERGAPELWALAKEWVAAHFKRDG
jgi:putative hydrolase of HD superfamily